MIHARLEQQGHLPIIFNPWGYSEKNEMWAALMVSLNARLEPLTQRTDTNLGLARGRIAQLVGLLKAAAEDAGFERSAKVVQEFLNGKLRPSAEVERRHLAMVPA